MASGEMSPSEFTAFLTTVLVQLVRSSTDGSLHFIFMDWRHAGELLEAARSVYSEFKNVCVWVKENAGQGSLYRSQHELVFVFKRGKTLIATTSNSVNSAAIEVTSGTTGGRLP